MSELRWHNLSKKEWAREVTRVTKALKTREERARYLKEEWGYGEDLWPCYVSSEKVFTYLNTVLPRVIAYSAFALVVNLVLRYFISFYWSYSVYLLFDYVLIPQSVGIMMVALFFYILTLFASRRDIEIDREISDRCVSCGYDLRATPSRCPECDTIPPRLK
jgi:hypothetical protein